MDACQKNGRCSGVEIILKNIEIENLRVKYYPSIDHIQH